MDSSPDSGPIMTSALSCSIRRLVSLMAVSAWSLEHPMPASTSGWPLMAPPVQPSRGLFRFFGRAPANCESAETTPARSWLSKDPNAPWQSERTPMRIGFLEPPVSRGTAFWGPGSWTVDFLVAMGPVAPPLLSPLELDEPQPAAPTATTPARTAHHAPRLILRTARISPPPAGGPKVAGASDSKDTCERRIGDLPGPPSSPGPATARWR